LLHCNGFVIPHGLLIVNAIGAFLIGLIATILLQKVDLPMEYRAAIMLIMVGAYLALSGLYITAPTGTFPASHTLKPK